VALSHWHYVGMNDSSYTPLVLSGVKITKADVIKFQMACKKYYGSQPDDEQALCLLELLVAQMQSVYKPITKQQFNKMKETKT
jgi:hypothetical protein